MAVSFLTLNVQGLRALSHRQTLMQWLNCFGPDIVCLQETHSKSEREFSSWFSSTNVNIQNSYNYKCISSPGTVRSCGVAILFKPNFSLESCFCDQSGRLVIGNFKTLNRQFQVACLYGPNKKTLGQTFFESFFQALDIDFPVFLCGDFNTVVDPLIDRSGCNPLSPWAYNWSDTLQNLMSTFDLSDAWRVAHPQSSEFTWHRANGSQASRLDMIWLPQEFLSFIRSIDILPFFRSDHCYVFMEIEIPPPTPRGPGVWKFNSSHLKDEEFRNSIIEFWDNWRMQQSRFSSLASWWDAGKARIKSFIRNYSCRKARKHRESIRSLNAALFHIQRRINQGEPLTDLLNDVKKELEIELLTDAKGAQLRARMQWAEEGEATTSYFLQQEKVLSKQKFISRIRRLDGMVVSQPAELLSAWSEFYSQLYTAQNLDTVAQDSFLGQLERKLSPDEATCCDGPLTFEECERALRQMPNHKSPGLDGLPAEFYVSFWNILGRDLVNVLNACFSSRYLSASQRSGLITLLYKKDDKLEMPNWRPITLLCVDYKILSKALANRLLKVIRQLISADQSCGIPGRFIGENIRLMHDIIDYANDHHLPGVILSLDQEKAFDRVDWIFMQRVLATMGFGDNFRAWVSLLYRSANSRILVNGFLTEPFPVSRGVRQGCPLSPLLYVLVAESLACAIRADPEIDGFSIPFSNINPKLSQYADDTTVFSQSDSSIKSIFRLFRFYESASGAKLNLGKCKGLLIGSWKSRTALPCHIKCTSESIVALGSNLSNNRQENWGGLLDKFTSLLNIWQRRSLSFRGRTIIVNVLGLSKFWYLSTVSVMPDDIVKQINQKAFSFIWGKKREGIKRITLCQRPSAGGLGMTHVSSKLLSLMSMWVKRYFLGEFRWWQCFFQYYIRRAFKLTPQQDINKVFSDGIINANKLKRIPTFYATVLLSWDALGGSLVSGEWKIPRTSTDLVPLRDLTANIAYRILLGKKEEPLRCVSKFKAWDLSPANWKHVWSNLLLWKYVRSVFDTNFLIAHASLPTKDRLIHFRMNVSPSCHCGIPETLIHLFTECAFAKRLILWFLSLVQRFNRSILVISPTELLLGFARSRQLPIAFNALLGIVRHRIWLERNAFTFENRPPDYNSSLVLIKSTFRCLIKVQRRSCQVSHFSSQWLANGVFGRLRNGQDLIIADVIK